MTDHKAIREAARVDGDYTMVEVPDLRALLADLDEALAALQAQPSEVSDEEIDRICYLATEIRFAKTDDAAQAVIDQIRAILALRPQSESEARRAAQEQLYAERERHTAEVKRLQAEIGRLQSLRPQYSSPAAEPVGRAVDVDGEIRLIPYDDDPATSPLSDGSEVFCAPLNLNCKSVQKRLMAQWGYEVQPAREPMTDEQKAAPKLIGWRTENFLWETDDVDKARNWEPNIGVLPIFEGDPNTKLGSLGITAPAGGEVDHG